MTSPVRIDEEVTAARAEGRPVVVLESTIFSRLGLPDPDNREALARCLAAIRARGAVPALTAVLDGTPMVGVPETSHERILAAETKVARRDLPVAVAEGLTVGATTVSSTLMLAASAGIEVFATGGIGGVHRDSESDDVSADLAALAEHPVVTVSAGAKVFLDLAATLERLETLSVPVLGLGTSDFPAFHAASSGLPVQRRVEAPAVAAAVLRARLALGDPGGVLLAVPVPAEHALALDELERAVELAHAAADERGVTGPDLTPFVLAHLADATDGRSVTANLALAEHNAAVAAEVARALA